MEVQLPIEKSSKENIKMFKRNVTGGGGLHSGWNSPFALNLDLVAISSAISLEMKTYQEEYDNLHGVIFDVLLELPSFIPELPDFV